MINFNKLAKQLINPSGVIKLPSGLTQAMINEFPASRIDNKLIMQHEVLKKSANVLRLPKEERILLSMLLTKDSYTKIVNEIPHLYFIAKQANQRSYFLNDLDILNPRDYKMGDIVVPVTNIKYEVKSYDKVHPSKIQKLINQYKDNNFEKNNIHFNICFNNISDCNIEEVKN